jgi:hypothetical protein
MSNETVNPKPPREHAPRPPEAAPDEQALAALAECFADLDNHRQRAFLAGFVAAMSVHGAARLSGVDRSCHYDWMSKDGRYAERFERARQMIADHFEAEIWRRAFVGVDTPLHWRGEITAWYKTYSDALTVFAMRALKPEVYRRTDPEFDIGGPTAIEITIKREGEEKEEPLPSVSIPVEDPSTLR